MIRCAIIFILFLQLSYTHAKVIRIYVSPQGSLHGLGTEKKPFSSIQFALDESSRLLLLGKDITGVEIILLKGAYRIDSTIEIIQNKNWSSKVPLAIFAKKGDVAVLEGGEIIPTNLIVPVTDTSFLQRLPVNVKRKIKQVNLAKTGIINPGYLYPTGFSRNTRPAWLEVFFDGVPGRIARWPNDSSIRIERVIDTGLPKNLKGGAFTYPDIRNPFFWKTPSQIWVSGYFMHGFAEDAIPISEIDPVKRIIKTQLPSIYGFGSGKAWQRWFAYNIPEELDTAGEYYTDIARKILYFLPPENVKAVKISKIETPLIALMGVRNVSIRNLQFSCSRGMGVYIDGCSHVRVADCSFNNLGTVGVCIQPRESLIDFKYRDRRGIGILGHKNDSSNTSVLSYNTDVGIIRCNIYNTGAGGIILGGGHRDSLRPGKNFVSNTIIHNFNRIQKSYRPAVLIFDVGNRVTSCEIYNAPSMAIYIHGNDHIISYNSIHHVVTEVNDQAAIYYGRDPTERGLKVMYNFFHHLGNTQSTSSIYHDDGACGMTVSSNIFYKAGKWGGYIGGGSDIVYTNNIFIDCPNAIHVDNRLENWMNFNMAPGGLFHIKMDHINVSNSVYFKRYPELETYWREHPETPSRNLFINNLLINVFQSIEGNKTYIHTANNYQTNERGKKRFLIFKDDEITTIKIKEIQKLIPGFKGLYISQIGPKK